MNKKIDKKLLLMSQHLAFELLEEHYKDKETFTKLEVLNLVSVSICAGYESARK